MYFLQKFHIHKRDRLIFPGTMNVHHNLKLVNEQKIDNIGLGPN